MGRIFASDQIRLGGALLSGSGAALFYAGNQLAQGSNAVSQSQQVIAGSGLEGGGAFNNGNLTLNIGSGSGIAVNANNINIDLGGVVTSMLADGAVTNAKVSDSASINVSKLQYSGFTLQGGSGIDPSSQTVNLGSTVTLHVATDNTSVVISSDKIAVGTITNSNISESSINPTKLVHSGITVLGGSGLQPNSSIVNLGNSITLNVATDNSTLEVDTDVVRLKVQGITNSHINDSAAISVSKLNYSGITVVGGSGIQPDASTVNLGGSVTLHVATDNSTLEVNSDALRVKSLGLSNSHLSESAAISVTKLASSGITIVGGSGIQPDSSTVNLGNSVTLNVATDNSTLEVNGDALRVKSLGLTNSHISESAAINVTKLSNSGIGFAYANGLTGSLTTNLGQTNSLTLNLDSNTLSAGGNNTLRVLKTSGTLSQQSLHAGVQSFAFDGASNVQIAVDGTVVRTTGVQVIAGNKTFNNNLTVNGDFFVSGTTFSISSNEVNIGDSRIVLNSTATTATASDGGLVVHTGISGNAPEIIWSQAFKEWQVRGEVSGVYFGLITDQNSRAGTTNLLVGESSKIVFFDYTFASAPVITALIKAPSTADLMGLQISDVTTTGVGFIFTTSVPENGTHTLHWKAQSAT